MNGTRVPVHSFGESLDSPPRDYAFDASAFLQRRHDEEQRRRKRELYLFLFHLTLACVPAHLFCAFLLYLLYWSK